MLTIHTPIELKNDPSILTLGNGFAERMQANYRQLGSDLKSEDLLHLFSAPPEIYLAGEGAHSLVDLTNNFHSQEIRLNLINNVLNRVLLSDNYDMTYQDEVFITNTLRKLGVTDVKEFMRQVQILKQETVSRNELIDLYWNNREELTELSLHFEQARREEQEAGDEQETAGEAPVLWLHQEIIDRLQTGAVYQEMRNYMSQRMGDEHFLTRQEMQISEQSVMAEHILLNRLKNQTTMESMPLVYHSINSYELGDVYAAQTAGGQTIKEMVQAVLLRAMDQVYAVRYGDLHRQGDIWYELSNAVYETAVNTFERFEAYHNRTQLAQTDVRDYYTRIQTNHNHEITALQRLLERRREQQILYESESGQDVTELSYRAPEQEVRQDLADIYEDARVTNENYIRYRQQRQEINNLRQGDELLNQQIQLINQNNEKRQERIERLEQQIQEQTDIHIDRAHARDDVLRAIEHPQEVLLEYMNAQTPAELRELEQREILREIYDEDTIRIFETIEQYRKEPALLLEKGIVIKDAAGQLARDIQLQYLTQQETEETREQQTREVHREVERIRTEYARRQENDPVRREHSQRHVESVELYHRENETTLDESLLEELRSVNRQTLLSETKTQELVNDHTVIEETITNRINELQLRNDQELEELVARDVKRQLRGMSEQVYQKLEKRMDTERRRRGI